MLRTLFRLPAPDALMLAAAVAMVAGTRWALWALPYRWVSSALEPGRVWRQGPRDALKGARYRRRVIWAVSAASRRLLPKKPCLTQALVARWLLALGGHSAELRIGVALGERRELLAHAWLEQAGHVILGGNDSPLKYKPFDLSREPAP